MKKILLLITISCLSFAKPGNDQGGGGSRIESAFRLSATSLIGEIAKNKTANELCPAASMSEGLNKADIQIVDDLENHLDAWTKPGLIKLKKSSWSKNLGDDERFAPSLAALILHEIYRTTNECDDDTGALSTAVVKLLQNTPDDKAKRFRKLIALSKLTSTAVQVPDFGKVKKALCEDDIQWNKPVKAGIYCIMVVQIKQSVHENAIIVRTTGQKNVQVDYLAASGTALDVIERSHIYINEEMPMYLMLYMNSGQFYYGLNLDYMRLFW